MAARGRRPIHIGLEIIRKHGFFTEDIIHSDFMSIFPSPKSSLTRPAVGYENVQIPSVIHRYGYGVAIGPDFKIMHGPAGKLCSKSFQNGMVASHVFSEFQRA